MLDGQSGGVGPFEVIVSQTSETLALRMRELGQGAPAASTTGCRVDMEENIR